MHAIHHVLFPSTDLERTRQWYGAVLGMTAVDLARFHPEGGLGTQQRPEEALTAPPRPVNDAFLMMSAGRWDLHFLKVDEMHAVAPVHIAIEVDDWDAVMANLQRLGIPVRRVVERPHDQSKSCDLSDPDGTTVELVWHAGWHRSA